MKPFLLSTTIAVVAISLGLIVWGTTIGSAGEISTKPPSVHTEPFEFKCHYRRP
jgi:hypothetical protein